MNMIRNCDLVGTALGLLLSASPASAVLGVADATILAGDLTDGWKWPRELAEWTQVIENTRAQVGKVDELIQLAGKPQEVAALLIDSVPDLMKPLDEVIGLETRKDALRLSRQLYSLGSVAVQTYDDAKQVGPNYEAFGETVKRDPKRYARFVFQEAMNARYKKAVANAEAVEQHEAKLQKKVITGLKNAETGATIEMVSATLLASKQRSDLAQQKAAQAKGELDAFHGELLVEDARKAEADREWAEAVVRRMRDKALAGYQSQFSGGGASDRDEAGE